MDSKAHFTPALFEFLAELSMNNDREWFQANKARYERDVRNPLLDFVADFGERLRTISPHMVADPRASGGSMFRIYRDVRFSKDKSPYKTNAGAHFRHEVGREVHGPGFYLLDTLWLTGAVCPRDPVTQVSRRPGLRVVAGQADRWSNCQAGSFSWGPRMPTPGRRTAKDPCAR